MIKISPYTPLFFNPSTDGTGLGCNYVQTFAKTDHIFLEIIADVAESVPIVSVRNDITDFEEDITMNTWKMNDTNTIYYSVITQLPTGYYFVVVNGVSSEIFKVTDLDSDLEDTALIQYSCKDNRHLCDGVFFIDNAQVFFDFRIPGGFKDNGWGFQVEGEQFVTSDSDIVQLSAIASTQKVLTIGFQCGCPIWFGEKINTLLCCDYIYIDGVRYCRKETSVPEISEVLENSRSFVFKQLLQKINRLDPVVEDANKLIYRRTGEDMRVAGTEKETRIRIC